VRAPTILVLMIVVLSLPFPGVAQTSTPPLPRLPFDAAQAAVLRAEWAQAFGLAPSFTNSLGMKLVLIPGGRFDI